LDIVRAIKIHNLSIQQPALEFNMNYRALNAKSPEYVTTKL